MACYDVFNCCIEYAEVLKVNRYIANSYQRVEYNKGNFYFDQEVKSQHTDFLKKGLSFE